MGKRIIVDFSQATTFEPLEAGTYSAIIEKVLYVESQNNDFGGLNFVFKVVDNEKYENRQLFMYRSLVPKAMGFMLTTLEGLEIEPEEFAEALEAEEVETKKGSEFVVINPNLAGKTVKVDVVQEEVVKPGTDKKRTINKVEEILELLSNGNSLN